METLIAMNAEIVGGDAVPHADRAGLVTTGRYLKVSTQSGSTIIVTDRSGLARVYPPGLSATSDYKLVGAAARTFDDLVEALSLPRAAIERDSAPEMAAALLEAAGWAAGPYDPVGGSHPAISILRDPEASAEVVESFGRVEEPYKPVAAPEVAEPPIVAVPDPGSLATPEV